jgi:hypothetical protein
VVALEAPAEKVEARIDVGDQGLLRRQAWAHPVTTLAISSRRAFACAFVPGRPKVRGSPPASGRAGLTRERVAGVAPPSIARLRAYRFT